MIRFLFKLFPRICLLEHLQLSGFVFSIIVLLLCSLAVFKKLCKFTKCYAFTVHVLPTEGHKMNDIKIKLHKIIKHDILFQTVKQLTDG